MGLRIIALILSPVIPVLLYRYILKRDLSPEEGRIKPSKYIVGAVFGMTLCTLLIIILELTWDRLFMPGGCKTLTDDIISSFLRAALLEEAVKKLFSVIRIKKTGCTKRVEFMLMAGTIGLGYGFIEKLVLGNPAALITNTIMPFHMLFQFLMGEYIFRARVAEAEGDLKAKRIDLVKAYLYPFLVHGLWDSALSVVSSMTERDDVSWMPYAGVIGLLALVAAGIVIEIIVIKKVIAISAGEENRSLPVASSGSGSSDDSDNIKD